MTTKKLTKLLALYLPYILLGLVATNIGEAWRLAEGKELGDKIMAMMGTVPVAFANPLPSLHPLDLLVGLCCGAGLRLAVYLRGKNAKKYRHGMEYGSARWGTAKDIEPFMAPKFADNIILTKTERLMMSNRPPDPKNARNKNVLVVGGSGSGKTRFWLKPNLLQCHSSYVVTDPNGTLKQKWETFTDLADAKNRKKEVEYKESVGTFVAPQCRTLKDLLTEYVALYGKTKWALSTYQSNTALISNYIVPLIGSMKLQDLTTRVIEGYYQRLLKYEAVDPMCGKRQHQYVSPGTVRSVHKILRSAFEQAVKWELMEKNPCIYATLPKYTAKKRDIWTAETLFHALEVCDDPRLRLCINLSFSCSLRLGELLGLTWDCVDISPESIEAGRASIYINKELQRVDIASLNALENKNVITRFPSLSSRCTTVQVLKSPKTDSSIRTIFLPKTVAEMLVQYKAEQDMTRDALGTEYADYNLVVAGPLGMPTEQSTINGALKQLIEENNLPKVVFHSFRHSSITYKLKLNGGDIKAVQGDSGHAQASMVTEQYAHILDDDRRLNAQRFDDFFYQHHGAEPEVLPRAEQSAPKASPVDTDAAAALAKLLADPSMATLIKNLAKNL